MRGPMAPWDMNALLLRQILLTAQGANWQRSGGKSAKPKPIELPDGKDGGGKPARTKPSGAEMARRLQSLGQIPADIQI